VAGCHKSAPRNDHSGHHSNNHLSISSNSIIEIDKKVNYVYQ
jgi:hypothetical protein